MSTEHADSGLLKAFDDLNRKVRALGELYDLRVDPNPLDWEELADLTAAADVAIEQATTCTKCPTLKQIRAVCVNGDRHLREVTLIGQIVEGVLDG